MINLTRLNGNPILLNCDLIKIAEASPDTMLTLINGEKLIVKESLQELKRQVIAFKVHLLNEVSSTSPGRCAAQQLQHLARICPISEAPALEALPFDIAGE